MILELFLKREIFFQLVTHERDLLKKDVKRMERDKQQQQQQQQQQQHAAYLTGELL